MTRMRAWLRPPRNLLILFALIVCLPAATLIVLGIRLLEQDRALARQRQIELLDHAADLAVRVLEQDIAARRKLLEAGACTPADTPEDSFCIVARSNLIRATPGRIPYYPVTQHLKELPSQPFQELESFEFREPPDLDRALEISRKLAVSNDDGVRAGALLRQGRILRKMERTNEALAAFGSLSGLQSVAINGEPADLVARRTRCAVLEEQSRTAELRQEAQSLAADLRAGKWQLDRDTFLHVNGKLNNWLGAHTEPTADEEAHAAAAAWVYEKWLTEIEREGVSSGIHVLNSPRSPVIVWSFDSGQATAFVAGPRFLESHWMASLQKAVQPARVWLAGGDAPPDSAARVQRTAADTGLPWTLIVTSGRDQEEPAEFAARRRNLAAGLAALVILIAAGSYFIWRAVNRELSVARLQSDFVSAVSHEFRTPLTTLRQFNELLAEEDGPTPEKRRTFYQAQTRATERLHRLVESLLDFGRMEAGRHPYKFKPLDVGVLAHDVTEEFLRETNGLGFDVKCGFDSGPHPVSADAEALARALWNLLDNAVKYSGNSRQVEVRVGRANGSVSIAVRDYGIGIPFSEQQTVFQKFVRGAASTTGSIQGTGLGLAMVRHIVQAHNGAVNLQSVEGKGSTFTIVLPVRE